MSNQGFGTNMPAPELLITPDLATRLLVDQHPDLADLPLSPLSRGWDNTMFRLGSELTVRLPHRQQAAGLLEAEQRWLPVLDDQLPIAVPTPLRVGTATEYYPWPWSVLRWFDGEPIGITPDLDGQQAAEDLGRFLAALHQPAPDDAPINTGRGVPLVDRQRMTIDRINALGDRVDGAALLARWARYVELPVWDGPPVWLHADLHPLNILQRDRRITAVIDFGDITSGDPATDLAIAYSVLEPKDREAFLAATESKIRPVDEAMWLRAEGWAMSVGLAIVNSSADSPLMYQIGLRMMGQS